MRRVALFAAVSALCMAAADVSGKWSGSFKADAEDQTESLYMVFQQDGGKLTGSGGPNEAQQHPMQNGKVEGNRLTFEVAAGKGPSFLI